MTGKIQKPDVDWLPNLDQSQEAFEIAHAVAEEYRLDVRVLYERSRMHPIPEARFMVWYILYSRGFTYSHLGRLFNRDHGSIMNGVANFKSYSSFDRNVMQRWERMAPLANTDKLCNEYVTQITGSCTVRSNHELSEAAIRERALAQCEAGLVMMDVSRITKQEAA